MHIDEPPKRDLSHKPKDDMNVKSLDSLIKS